MSLPAKHPVADAFAIIAASASTASYFDHLEQGLRILATVVAIAAGVVALYQRLKRRVPPRDDEGDI